MVTTSAFKCTPIYCIVSHHHSFNLINQYQIPEEININIKYFYNNVTKYRFCTHS